MPPLRTSPGRIRGKRSDLTWSSMSPKSNRHVDPDEGDDESTRDSDSTVSGKRRIRSPISIEHSSRSQKNGDIGHGTAGHNNKNNDDDEDDNHDDDDDDEEMTKAIERKVSELAASGWRPTEETDTQKTHGVDGKNTEEEDDDEAYNAIDLLSDSEEDDKAVRKHESKTLMDEPEIPFRRQSFSDAASDNVDWDGFDYGNFSTMHNVDEPLYLLDFDESRPATFLMDDDDANDSQSTFKDSRFIDSQRKVRFEDELDGSDVDSTDEETVADRFPDIFLDSSHLGSSFQVMNDDNTYLDDGSDAGSVWDFNGDEMDVDDVDNEDSDSDDTSLDDDDTDGGYTTDEEPKPQAKTQDKSSKIVESNTKPLNTPQPKAKQRMNTVAITHRMPKAGTFELDPRRPVLLVDGTGEAQRNMLYPARIQTPDEKKFWKQMRRSNQSRVSSPRTTIQMSPGDESDEGIDSPFLTPIAPFSASGVLRSDQVVGPSEAFVPWTSVDVSGSVTENNSILSFSDNENDMDVDNPFINFEAFCDDLADDSADTSETVDATPRIKLASLPALNTGESTPTTPISLNRRDTLCSSVGGSGGDDLLSHLSRNKSLVNSFRMNQHYVKQLASKPANPSARATLSEMNAIKAGRRKAGNTPITPLRKKRGGGSMRSFAKVDWTKALGNDSRPNGGNGIEGGLIKNGLGQNPKRSSMSGRAMNRWGQARGSAFR